MDLRVKKATIITGQGCDKIILDLDSTSPFPKMGYAAKASIETQPGYGTTWVLDNLAIPPEVIKIADLERHK